MINAISTVQSLQKVGANSNQLSRENTSQVSFTAGMPRGASATPLNTGAGARGIIIAALGVLGVAGMACIKSESDLSGILKLAGIIASGFTFVGGIIDHMLHRHA